ncbi:Zn-dependent hydrolase [Desulfosporosinus nitroreducens]|uniref:Zn-dependent hydrolase n=1 Tax=Desulfosporosinus nitroreducens TaxID=2018668 RepID=A0ABT8QNG2_9FIRM|nr:Zn-dependent hydrolase [Desulfosporosinus nitroreducens]MDO0822180.1 Zn-dependent hydrolase [Desulfosporosinus nitroreducens]
MINADRLWKNLLDIGEIGKNPDGGITRLAFTKEDRQAIKMVEALMKEAGLAVHEDEVGNLIGRKEGEDSNAPAVLIGSHLDSVFNGGIFDGSLGVLAGIEVLQSMKENGISTKHPIEVYVFRDEEGCRFNFSLLGSRGMSGTLKLENLEYRDNEGISLAKAMKSCGMNPKEFFKASRRPDEIKAYLELHVEQGKVLECENLQVGVVTGIASSLRLMVTVTGKADHAGATPMNLRFDALAAAAQIIGVVEKETRATKSAVGTVGQIHAYPGGINIIPGRVEFTVDLRDVSIKVAQQLEKSILSQAEDICTQRGLKLEVDFLQRVPPAPCSPEIIDTIAESCRELGIKELHLPSGAGHDAMQVVNLCPIGMIFVRSQNGISHHPAEWSTPEDCTAGAKVLYQTVLKLAE